MSWGESVLISSRGDAKATGELGLGWVGLGLGRPPRTCRWRPPSQPPPGGFRALLTGCSRFLLSSGRGWGEYYRVAHGTGLMPNETQIPCRALVACLAPHQS